MTAANRYSMHVAVRVITGARTLVREPAFEFESLEEDPDEVVKDGKRQFQNKFSERLKKDKQLAERMRQMPYSVRVQRCTRIGA
ncbi:hypothetical protein [Paraburkholderia sp. BCC1886]|uniref:hypothetical protein n=1 Tax=Paraburkholderia sp. BCC1886 TaxID=2562670 RepID=UPI0011823C67|nr:hypothetical protein [Paraburkholderia sp. BCC1886]